MTTLPKHVAIIMDGNGRWATGRNLARHEGHRAGADAVRRTVRTARELGLSTLTLYAFSAQNWGRPAREVTSLMRLLATFLREEQAELTMRGIRLVTIGEDFRLPAPVRALLAAVKTATMRNRGMTLCLALSYGARESIVEAARTLVAAAAAGVIRPKSLDESVFGSLLETRALPPLDLVIRTSGEQRLSNFLLWEAAYAELYFTDVLWPDFGRAELESALAAFARRRRRFGLTESRSTLGRAGKG